MRGGNLELERSVGGLWSVTNAWWKAGGWRALERGPWSEVWGAVAGATAENKQSPRRSFL
jgi:hypothetical protein